MKEVVKHFGYMVENFVLSWFEWERGSVNLGFLFFPFAWNLVVLWTLCCSHGEAFIRIKNDFDLFAHGVFM